MFVLASFAVPFFLTVRAGGTHHFDPQGHTGAYYAVSFAFYAVSYFVVIFFNCGLVWCAYENLNGRPARFSDGIGMAAKTLPQIIVWTLISSTVGTILRAISERAGLIGQIVIGILGMVWSLATFFVVPLLIVERQNAVKALKSSSSMLKRTWGEQIIGNTGLGFATGLLMLIGFIPLGIGVFIAIQTEVFIPGVVGVLIAVVYWLILGTVSAALSGIYQAALYMYASTGTAPAAYSPQYIQEAFLPKERKFFGKKL